MTDENDVAALPRTAPDHAAGGPTESAPAGTPELVPSALAAAQSPESDEPAVLAAEPSGSSVPAAPRPTFVFFGTVAAISLAVDVSSKAWAEITLSKRSLLDPSIEIIQSHLYFTLAYNRGGAWGLLQNASEVVRRPFFLLVSALAIAFIVNLYGRLHGTQKALKWGLPLVLGGALGNLSDRIIRSSVIDFIDYQGGWVEAMNRLVAKVVPDWTVTQHWPTFNVADVSICIGVGLMAVDMFTSRRGPVAGRASFTPAVAGHVSSPPSRPAP